MTDWEAVVGQNVEIVHRTVHRIVGNHADAWDCVQETFLEAVKIERHQTVRNWSALLRRLATFRALDLLRRRCRYRNRHVADANVEYAEGPEPDPASHAEASELAERLRAAVARLPRRQAEVFCLTYFEQMAYEEIAAQLDVSPTATRMLLSRARRRLAELLEPRPIVAPNQKD